MNASTPLKSSAVSPVSSGMSLAATFEHNLASAAKGDPWVQIELARHRIGRHLQPTPLVKGRPLTNTSIRTYFKCDQMRRTGAYKERGALNALLCLSKEEAANGVIAASAGNHAQALAYHGGKLGIPVTVVMPRHAPIVKIQSCRGFGANVVMHGADFDEAKAEATRLSEEKHLKYINGYDHPDIISGAGTCGLEILEQLPSVDVVVVPVGGGGLLSGIALAIKRLHPKVRIIGVESERCPNVTNALAAGKVEYTPVGPGGTIADGLAVNTAGANAFKLIQTYVDKVITVPETYIAKAILHLLEVEKMLVEGGGAAGLAGIFSGKLDDELKSKNVVTVITGGNIDITLLGRIINQGLYDSGRLWMFDVAISNRVGGLAAFAQRLSETGASVKSITQETPLVNDVRVTTLHMEVETTNEEHWYKAQDYLRKHGFDPKPYNAQKYSDVDLSKL